MSSLASGGKAKRRVEALEDRVVLSSDAMDIGVLASVSLAPLIDVMSETSETPLSVLSMDSQHVGDAADWQDVTAISLTSHDDVVPNFGRAPTVTAIKSGNWSDRTIWSTGVVPTTDAVVRIGEGLSVTYNMVSDTAIKTVAIAGELKFATNVSTRLTVSNLLVYAQGKLMIGSAAAPIADSVKAEVVFSNRPLDLVNDPSQWGNGLVAFGEVRMYGRAMTDTFVQLTAEALAGSRTLKLSTAASGWKVGDSLYIPDTRELRDTERGANYVSQNEYVTITAISTDGKTITIDRNLSFNHKGAYDAAGQLSFLPHVANLSRNVNLRSAAPNGVRGHTAYLGRADIDIRFAGFWDLGRTTMNAIDSTTYNANGTVSRLGTNQIGRYAVHIHHLIGPEHGTDNGYQYTLIGNAIAWTDLGAAQKPKWAMAIHGASYGLIQENVVNNGWGAGIVTEDGSESFNVFERNFVSRIRGQGGRDANGYEGAGFYFRGPNNYVRGNVATNILGDTAESAYGYKYFQTYLGDIRVPLHPGADTMTAGEYQIIDGNSLPIMEFSDNQVYGATESGLTNWWVGSYGHGYTRALGYSVIKNFTAWNVYRHAYYGYPSDKLIFDGFTVRGDVSVIANPYESPMGMFFADYEVKDTIIRNADIQGMRIGIYAPQYANGEFRVENSVLRNLYNVYADTPYNVNGSGGLPARLMIFDNVRFQAVPGYANVAIQKRMTPVTQGMGGVNYIVSDRLLVKRYQGVAGDDFEVFANEQAPSYIVPLNGSNGLPTRPSIGAPVAGLTNQQAWAQYGIAIGGAVAPVGAGNVNVLARPEIQGLSIRTGFTITPSVPTPTAPMPMPPPSQTPTPPPSAGAPTANADSAITFKGKDVSILVLSNDYSNGGVLRIVSASGGQGTVSISDSGTPSYTGDDVIVYRPASGFTGADSFQYSISNGQATSTATVKVNVVAIDPNVVVKGEGIGVRWFSYSLNLSATSPNPSPTFTYRIDWNGDGTIDETVTAAPQARIDRTFTQNGVYNVRVTAVDATGAVSSTAGHNIVVGDWAMLQNLGDPTKMDLVVATTSDNESIRVTQSGQTAKVTVTSYSGPIDAPTAYGPSRVYEASGVTGIVRVNALGGDDILDGRDMIMGLRLDGSAGNDIAIGGAGDDTLLGGWGNDILVGRSGNDMLLGDIGANVLIGGAGGDTLHAVEGSNLFVTSWTNYDVNVRSLVAVGREWFSTDPYLVKILDLSSSLLTIAPLLPGISITNDAWVDKVFASGSQNWYLADLSLDQLGSPVLTDVTTSLRL